MNAPIETWKADPAEIAAARRAAIASILGDCAELGHPLDPAAPFSQCLASQLLVQILGELSLVEIGLVMGFRKSRANDLEKSAVSKLKRALDKDRKRQKRSRNGSIEQRGRRFRVRIGHETIGTYTTHQAACTALRRTLDGRGLEYGWLS